MSGHSKWANIKHKKGKADALRGKITTKISREITIAVRMGGADPTGNMKLKLALSKAKANNIPKDNIQRAIQKGAGALEGQSFEEITYEGYGPAGVAMMVSCLTDNRNRTAADVRHVFSKHGGNLGAPGCVSCMFSRKGVIIIEKTDDIDEDALMETALEAGAEDMITHDDSYEIQTAPENYTAVHGALTDAGYEMVDSDVEFVPSMESAPKDAHDLKQLKKMIDILEDNDDVQKVHHNCSVDLEEVE